MATRNKGERKYVIILQGNGPFVWQNEVMYEKGARKAFERVHERYPEAKLCQLEEVHSEIQSDNL